MADARPEGTVVVCPADELRPGQIVSVRARGRRVAVACVEPGEYLAVADNCPHEGAPLSAGKVEREWCSSQVGVYERGQRYHVVCPWHNFEFDMESGRPPFDDPRLRVRTYRAGVEDGSVVLYLSEGGSR